VRRAPTRRPSGPRLRRAGQVPGGRAGPALVARCPSGWAPRRPVTSAVHRDRRRTSQPCRTAPSPAARRSSGCQLRSRQSHDPAAVTSHRTRVASRRRAAAHVRPRPPRRAGTESAPMACRGETPGAWPGLDPRRWPPATGHQPARPRTRHVHGIPRTRHVHGIRSLVRPPSVVHQAPEATGRTPSSLPAGRHPAARGGRNCIPPRRGRSCRGSARRFRYRGPVRRRRHIGPPCRCLWSGASCGLTGQDGAAP
jgi:hypothetical protein